MIAIDIPMPQDCSKCPLLFECGAKKHSLNVRQQGCKLIPVRRVVAETYLNPITLKEEGVYGDALTTHKEIRHKQISTCIEEHPEVFLEETYSNGVDLHLRTSMFVVEIGESSVLKKEEEE